MEFRKMVTITLCAKQKKTQMYRTDFWTLWAKARVGCFERTASKHVYYLWWNRLPAQAGCMRQVLGPGALGRPRGIPWRVRWEGGSGWGIHVTPWLIHVNVWQNPLQCCEVISLQLIKIKKKKQIKKKRIHLSMQEMQVWSLGQDNHLEKEMATHSRIFVWKIPWTEEPGVLESRGLQKSVIQLSNQTTATHTHTHTYMCMYSYRYILFLWRTLTNIPAID